MSKQPMKQRKLVLNLRVEIECVDILNELDSLKEVVEAGRGYGTVSGTIEIDGVSIGEVS